MFQGKRDSDSLPVNQRWGEKGKEKKKKKKQTEIIGENAVWLGHMVSISKKGRGSLV